MRDRRLITRMSVKLGRLVVIFIRVEEVLDSRLRVRVMERRGRRRVIVYGCKECNMMHMITNGINLIVLNAQAQVLII